MVDPGPSSTLGALEAGLARHGVPVEELRHVLLTHVHLDHAGAAGHLAARAPRATVRLHEEGAPHLADPARLVASTRRTFGDAHDRLWGDVRPVPAHRLRGWRPGEGATVAGLRPLHTPGHIDHHVAWLDESDGTLLAGDALGIVLALEAPTHPPTPPPGVDLEAWHRTLDEVEVVGPERIGVAHAGMHAAAGRAGELREGLDALEARVRKAVRENAVDSDARAWAREVRERQSAFRPAEEVERYFDVFRAETDYRGVERYVRKRRETTTSGGGAA